MVGYTILCAFIALAAAVLTYGIIVGSAETIVRSLYAVFPIIFVAALSQGRGRAV